MLLLVSEWTDTVTTGVLVAFVVLSAAAASAQCQPPYIKKGFETVVMNLQFTLTLAMQRVHGGYGGLIAWLGSFANICSCL